MSGKRDNILERQSLVFIQYSDNYLGIAKETERRLEPSRGWLWSLREIPRTQRNLWEEFPKLQQSHRVGLSRVESRRLELIPRTQENARTSSRMTLRTSGKFPVPEGTFGKDSEGYRSFGKATESFRVESRRPWTLYSGYGNWVQTQRSHFSQGFGGFALNPEVSISLCDILNKYNECLHTSLYLLCILRESGKIVIQRLSGTRLI